MKARRALENGQHTEAKEQPAPAALPEPELLALQRSAGNRVVAAMLAPRHHEAKAAEGEQARRGHRPAGRVPGVRGADRVFYSAQLDVIERDLPSLAAHLRGQVPAVAAPLGAVANL